MSAVTPLSKEASLRFACFGGHCSVIIRGNGPAGTPLVAAELVKRRLLEWHRQFSRFDPTSELSCMNLDPRESVPVSAAMARFAQAGLRAAAITDGLVDPTLAEEIERAGYLHDFGGASISPARLLDLAPPRRAAACSPAARWRQVSVDRRAGIVTRPPGLRLDSGGVAKGFFGDVLAGVLSRHESFAVEAAGDLRLGGAAGTIRTVEVADPFNAGSVLHRFALARGAVATSGITKRAWVGSDGRSAHHLLDPATGKPAFTGIVQATAMAPSGVEAEALAKAALLSSPVRARAWLAHGGVVVYDDGSHEVIDPFALADVA